MNVIDLGADPPTLDEVMGLAKGGLVVLRLPDGTTFALARVDDFEIEVELLSKNPEFMAYLKQRSQDEAVISLEDLRKELAL